jgi:hypothetical protein
MRKTLYVLYFASRDDDDWRLWGEHTEAEEFLKDWTGEKQLRKDIKLYFDSGQRWVIDKIEWEE